jgi:3-hydroxyisobutyrate dehydrogenase-like beta-hydroxyacid dehydrogenase
MAKLAFIGLGKMGTPMATRLLAEGNSVTVWNRTSDRMAPLVDKGASAARSPADAAADVDAVITMLANPQALEEVLFGEDGLARGLSPGQLLIDMSTIGPDEFRDAAARLPDGVRMVDAPVRGSVPVATQGRLDIYVGADDATYERVARLLAPLGNVRHVGGPGAGAATKVVVNSTTIAAMDALGEALALSDTLGLDRETVLDVLVATPIGGPVIDKRANIESGSYPANFKLSLALKDIRLVTAEAEKAGIDLKLARASSEWLAEADRTGAGNLDYSAVVATITGAKANP